MNRIDDLIHEISLDDINYYNITPASVRDVALSGLITSGPGHDKRYMPSTLELDAVVDMTRFAVSRGQMIDFGYWPNDMIREVGTRAGKLYCEGALGHPFSTPYIFLHSWDDDKLPFSELTQRSPREKHTCAYLVNPFPKEKNLLIDFESMTFEGMWLDIPTMGHKKCLAIGDRALLDADASRQHGFYAAQVIPYAMRFPVLLNNPEFQRLASNRNNDNIMQSACGNVIDPVMVALMLLNTRGVEQQTIAASPKLNKARIKSNKPPIPPYRKVDSASYVTAILARLQRSHGPGTGTHASPVMHVRQGHWRHYQTGERSFIRDTLVNATPEMRAQYRTQAGVAGRSHYVVKP